MRNAPLTFLKHADDGMSKNGGSPPVGEGVMESCVNAFVQPAVNKSCLRTGLTVKRRCPSFI
jgi:hypothetical protein